jgi:hypothetical protein
MLNNLGFSGVLFLLIIALVIRQILKVTLKSNAAEKELTKSLNYHSDEDLIYDEAVEKLHDILNIHHLVLSRKLEQALIRNDYGIVVGGDTSDVWNEFGKTVCKNIEMSLPEIKEHAKQFLEKMPVLDPVIPFDPTIYPTDGIEFEMWVGKELERFGWVTKITPPSSDQGVDIIAKKNAWEIAIQCKRYEGQVSNDAVQQIVAGKYHYGVPHAAVITNSSYTNSAKALAQSNNVLLLKIADIPNMEDHLRKITNVTSL